MDDLLQKIEIQYKNDLPFVIYAQPEDNTMVAMFQKEAGDHSGRRFLEKGFVLTSFDENATLFLPESECDVMSITHEITWLSASRVKSEVDISEKQNYITLVSKAIDHIRLGNASKIVTSRKKEIPLNQLDLSVLIKRLMALYPKAFRYIWYHPKSSLWCGATPEVLITTNGSTFTTMALAGTMLHDPKSKPRWTRKELNEQQWVTDAITEKLQRAASVIKVSKLRNHVAGSLVHLRTDFNGVLKKADNSLELLTRSLHPTPAVCGTPNDCAKMFIFENEGYDRSFYTGYLGPTEGRLGQSRIYVNLRCMKISDGNARLFAGGGVTEDSVAIAEFDETENKLQTMLQVLQPML